MSRQPSTATVLVVLIAGVVAGALITHFLLPGGDKNGHDHHQHPTPTVGVPATARQDAPRPGRT